MLPHNRDQNEHRGNKDQSQGDLRDGSRWKRFHFAIGAGGINFLMPARKCGEKEEGKEGEDDGNNSSTLSA